MNEERKQEVIRQIQDSLKCFGGNVVFRRPVIFTDTPHSPRIYIRAISIQDDLNAMGEELNAINQRLKLLKIERENQRADQESL